jgi:hypothetical protein
LLNELLAIEAGLAASGFILEGRHPDLNTPQKTAAVRTRLRPDGGLAEIEVLPPETIAKLWTLRDGNQNSFPFLQLKRPLLSLPDDRNWQKTQVETWKKLGTVERRRALRALARDFPCNGDWLGDWPEAGLKKSLRRRQESLAVLGATEAAAVPAAVERFLVGSRDGKTFLSRLFELLLTEVDEGESEWLGLAHQTLTKGGALYVDVLRGEFARDLADPRHVSAVSRALPRAGDETSAGRCALTGNEAALLTGRFPKPNLPVLGPTFLFSKNIDIPAAGRYGRFSADAFPVGSALAERLEASLRELTVDHRRGRSWRIIPGERPKRGKLPPQQDLLLAFVHADPEAPISDMIADDDEEAPNPEATFARRTERVIDAIKAKIGENFRRTSVELCVLRKVDQGNHKVIYHRAISIPELWDAASAWADGESNLPGHLRMPVPGGRGEKAESRSPRHVAPLQLPALTRSRYIHRGTTPDGVVGLSARDAFALFLMEGDLCRRARSTLQLIIDRHGSLLSGSAHALRKGFDDAKRFDRAAALKSLTLIGVLLSKLGHRKEAYMEATAFKLGQLLAVADVVHVGYCADRRSGDIPPVLLGNSVLTMAQSNPVRALAVLCRRWKPYGAWAKQSASWALAKILTESKDPKDKARGWAIIRAQSQASRAAQLTRELHDRLSATIDDAFRAELLLGYIAGLPGRRAEQGAEADDHEEAE